MILAQLTAMVGGNHLQTTGLQDNDPEMMLSGQAGVSPGKPPILNRHASHVTSHVASTRFNSSPPY